MSRICKYQIMWAALVSALVVGACGAVDVKREGAEGWDILKLTQSWPPAVCIYLENQEEKCNISSEIKAWVVHGLWPTKQGTEGPNFCNKSWPFNLSEVQTLRPRLDFNWPSITLHESSVVTWEHEWDKHGTCGTSLPALKNEFNYFNFTLGLHDHYNLAQMLASHGAVPRNDRSYEPEDLLTILKGTLGAYPTITCVEEKSSRNHYMEQIEVCLDTSFQPIDCSKSRLKPVQPPKSKLESTLHFHHEKSLKGQTLEDYLVDCPSSGVYYKQFSSK